MTSIIFLIAITLISIFIFNIFFEIVGNIFLNLQQPCQSALEIKTLGLILAVSLYNTLAYLGLSFFTIQGIFLLLVILSILRTRVWFRFFRIDFYPIFVVLAIVLMIIVFEQTYYDARVGHALSSKGIYLAGTIEKFIEVYNSKNTYGAGGVHQFYPKLLPFLSANFSQIYGMWNECVAILGQSLLYISIAYLILYEIDEKYKYIATILLMLGGGANLYAGYQDSTVAILIFLAYLNFCQKNYLIFLGCLAISALVKIEGLMYLFCGVLTALFFYHLFKIKFQRILLLAIIMPVLSFIVFKYVISDWGVDFQTRASLGGINFIALIERVIYVARFMFNKDLGFSISIITTLILFIISVLKKNNEGIRLGVFPLITFMVIGAYYVVLIPSDISYWVDYGFSRVLLGCFYCSFFYNLAFMVDRININHSYSET